ncbi:MAG: homoserine kinase [Pseudomonadota bacterium]
MAVYTDIAEDELRAFLAEYEVGELLSYKGIAEGVENSNFLLHTASGSYILTLYENRVNAADLPFFIGLMEHLAETDVTAPRPLKRASGEALGHLAGRPAAIVTFLEGMWPRRAKALHCREVGIALAKLHRATTDFSLERPNGLAVADWRALSDASSSRADSVVPGLAQEMTESLNILEAQWPNDLPRGTIHADLFPDNVFFLGDELAGLIDFYFACTDLLAYDLAICLNAWCFETDHMFNVTKARALFEGYQSVRPLESVEITALPLLAQGAAMRFLVTRLNDWLNVPPGALVVPKDPREYVVKLRFHSAIDDPSAYGLDL